jgi:hypothetical protein
MSMSKVALRGEPEFRGISVSTSGAELCEAMGSVRPRTHKGMKGERFGGNAGENVKRVGGNSVREIGDYGNAVPGIRSLVRRCVRRRGGVRKSRGRVRM